MTPGTYGCTITVMNYILLLNILIFATIITQFVVAFLFFRAIVSNFKEFISSPEAGEPSPLSLSLDSFSARLAKCLSVEVKTTLMGMLSGQARAETALNRETTEAVMSIKNPLVGGLLAALPKRYKNKIFKNPELAEAVIDKLGSTMGGMTASVPVTTDSGDGHSPKFKL